MSNSKAKLRTHMRGLRAQLSKSAQLRASLGLARSARRCSSLLRARRLASYSPFDGEIDPTEVMSNLAKSRVFLPRINNYRTKTMHFARARVSSGTSRFGIPEPLPTSPVVAPNNLDVILVPLLCFDRSGNRLGMGAGYYDRALSSLAHQPSTRPYLIGLAHHFQEVNSLTPQTWDVALDAILTDREFIQAEC